MGNIRSILQVVGLGVIIGCIVLWVFLMMGYGVKPKGLALGPLELELEPPDVLPQIQPFEPEMILIPAGEFLMGSDPSIDKYASSDEQPQHRLYLPDYYMGFL